MDRKTDIKKDFTIGCIVGLVDFGVVAAILLAIFMT